MSHHFRFLPSFALRTVSVTVVRGERFAADLFTNCPVLADRTTFLDFAIDPSFRSYKQPDRFLKPRQSSGSTWGPTDTLDSRSPGLGSNQRAAFWLSVHKVEGICLFQACLAAVGPD